MSRQKTLRFRVGAASTLGIFVFGAVAGSTFIHKEYRYRLQASESEIKKSAYFLVPQASMLLLKNDESAFLTYTRVVERIASKNNFSYVEIVDLKGNLKVPLDPMGTSIGHTRAISAGPWGSMAMGRDYTIEEEEYQDVGRVIEGVFGVLEQDRILGYVIIGMSKKPIEQALWKSLFATIGFLALSLAVSVSLALRFTRKATEPVTRLKDAVEEFKERGDLELFNIEGSQEVSVLASSMRGALAQIQGHKEEMERTIASIRASEGKAKHEIKTISDSFRKLSRHLKLEEAVGTILEDIVRQIVYCHETYLILTVNGEGIPLSPSGSQNAESAAIYPRRPGARLVSAELVEMTLKKGDIEVIPDIPNSVWKEQIAGGFQSCALYPLYSGESQPLGVLFLGMRSDAPFDAHELSTLRGVMEPIGIAFDRIFLHSQVERLAVHDSMTGLLNHQNVRERLAEALQIAQRQDRSVYVAMADLDKFKSVNDTYGHPVGDRVIQAFAQIVARSMRVGEFAGRYGGEEFLIVLGQSNLEGARTFAERIMKEVRQARVEADKGAKIAFTVSMGIAAFPEDGTSLDEVLENADSALYEAKKEGRDRAVIWRPDAKGLKII